MTNFKKSHYKIAMALLFSLLMLTVAACGNNSIQSEESSEISMPEQEESYVESTASSNVLIVYFSRMGNTEYPDDVDASTSASIVIEGNTFGTTEYMAHMIQESTGGDLHLIQTQEPYPVDFDELREQNRSEMGEGYFPALAESNLDIAQYDTVFIGYPILWGEAPRIISTFVESYDFSGKTVVPFCTSGGSGIGSSATNLEELTDGAQWLSGQRFSGGTSCKDMIEWVALDWILLRNKG